MHHIFPRRNPLIPLIQLQTGTFVFGDFPEIMHLSEQEKNWLVNLSGDINTTDAINLYSTQNSTATATEGNSLHNIIRIGLKSAGLLDANSVPNIARWLPDKLTKYVESEMTHIQVQATPTTPIIDNSIAVDRRHSLRVHIVGTNYLGLAIKSLLVDTGFTISDSARSAAVLILPSVSHPHVSDHDFAERERLPHLHVGIRHTKAVVGPLVVPEQSSCVRCDYLHRRDLNPTWPTQFIDWRNSLIHSTADPLLVHLTAAFSLSMLRNWIDGHEVANRAWSATMPIPSFTAESRPPHPLCGCLLVHQLDQPV